MTTSTLRAIETRYKGYRFRSRLEARWAVCFDVLGVLWEYEAEGFALPSGRYLPDFWFPDWEAFGEVKPTHDGFDQRTDELVLASGFDAIQLIGAPDVLWYPKRTFGHWERTPVVVDDWVHLAMSAEEGRLWHSFGEPPDTDATYLLAEPFQRAVTAARSARFEHGEAPR